MPAKNTVKAYVEKGFYHVYNRGVNKMPIFLDEQDFKVFFYYMDLYLLSKEELIKRIKNNIKLSEDEKNKRISKLLTLNNFYGKIDILCFVFMPNHFHFLLKQLNRDDMIFFLKSLLTKYSQYFNKKYKRIGPVFQGRYKAILINKEEYLLHLSRYIHVNPKEILPKKYNLMDYPWCSYHYYIKEIAPTWLNKDYILSYFKSIKGYGFSSYQGFIEGYQEKSEIEYDIFKNLLLD